MRFWTILLSLIVAGMVAVNAPAQEQKGGKKPHMTLKERFDKMDTNHDGTLSQDEFVAGHKRLGEEKAKALFAKMGGTTDKGLTFDQYKTAMEEWMKQQHKKKDAPKGGNP
jgi:Ca2+-binding EF-hand superfamily protein